MRRKHIVILVLIAAIAAIVYLLWPRASSDTTPQEPPATSLTEQHGRYLFNVTLHTPEEIAGLLTRAEQLAKTIPADNSRTGIALVLHGPEIEMFAKKNYPRFREMVDQAARLDAAHVIEVKMCRTEMRSRGIKEEDVPAFIEFVPYGPDEEERLRRNGYVYL
ncbi:MAG: DsrE family protein [Gammaproteobacteria bacterium]|nr:DsrE family protein [Gammaproteobacteria bacterium]